MLENSKEKGFFLSIECLLYLMEQYPSVFKLIFNNSQTKSFPLAIVSCKYVEILSSILFLDKQERGIPLHLPSVPAFPYFTHDLNAFETVFGIALQLFDGLWNSSTLNLNEIVQQAFQQLSVFLEKPPSNGVPSVYENMLQGFFYFIFYFIFLFFYFLFFLF